MKIQQKAKGLRRIRHHMPQQTLLVLSLRSHLFTSAVSFQNLLEGQLFSSRTRYLLAALSAFFLAEKDEKE